LPEATPGSNLSAFCLSSFKGRPYRHCLTQYAFQYFIRDDSANRPINKGFRFYKGLINLYLFSFLLCNPRIWKKIYRKKISRESLRKNTKYKNKLFVLIRVDSWLILILKI
jgi:hypothetical protein